MHRQVAVATALVCLVTPLFSAIYAQSCPPPSPPPITLQNAEICAGASDTASTPSGMATYSWSITHGSVLSSDENGNVTFTSDGSGDVVLSVTVTDANGCPSTNSVTVPLHSIDSPTITTLGQICPSGPGTDASVSDPAGGGSWLSTQWDATNGYFYTNTYPYQSSSTTGSTVHVYPDGSGQPVTLHVRVTDNQYCMADATTTIGVRTIAAPVITAPAQVCPSGTGGDLSVADPAEGGMWSNVQWDVTNAYFSGTSYPYQPTQTTYGNGVHFYPDGSNQPITVRVRVTDGQYCGNEATTTIAMRSIAPPVITAPAQVCPSGTGGDLSVADPAEGGMWSNVQWDVTNAYFSGTSYPYQPTQTTYGKGVHFYPDGSNQPITVRVRVSDGQYCGSEATTTIAMRSIAPPVITAPAQVCPSGTGGDLSVADPAEGGMWSNVQWDVTNAYFSGTSYPYQPTQTTYGNGVHFYPDGSNQPITVRVRVSDNQYCGSEATTTVAMATLAPPDIHLNMPDICPAGAYNSASIDNPPTGSWMNITWSVDHGTISSGPNNTYMYFNADSSGIAPVVHVTVQDDRGCIASSQATVSIRTIPAPEIHLNMPDICPAGAYNYASIDNPPTGSWMNIEWSVDHGTISNGPNDNYIYFNADSSGIAPVVHVTVRDDRGCSATNSATLSLRTIAAPEIHLNMPDICPAGAYNYASIDNPPTGSWMNIAWSVDHGTISNGPNNNYIYFNADSSGIAPVVHVTVQDDRGCMASNQATVSIRTIAAPEIHLSVPDICPAGTYNYASIDNPPTGSWMNITWSVDHGTISNGPNNDYIYFNADSSGIAPVVHVTVEDDRGCMASNQATVVLRTIAAPEIHLNMPDICPAGTYNYASIDNPPTGSWMNITWSVDHGTISNGPNDNYIYFNADSSGIAPVVHVTVQDDRGCVASGQTTMSIRTIAAPEIHLNMPDICPAGTSNYASIDNPPTGSWMNITWSVDHGTISNGPNDNYIYFNADGSGIAPVLHVTVQDDRGCTAENSATVAIRTIDKPAVTAGGPTTFCNGGGVTLTAPSGFMSYLWSNGQTTQSIFVGASGSYTVTVTDAGGCSATSDPTAVTVFVLPTPTISASGPTTFCAGGSVTLTASSASSYLWSNGATTQAITVNASGNYSVTVTDPNGCSGTSAATSVVVNSLAAPVITFDVPSFCPETSVVATVPAGYASYAWSASAGLERSGETTNTFTVGKAGSTDLTVSVTVTDSNGCSATSSAIISPRNFPTPTIELDATRTCLNGVVHATASDGPYNDYHWSVDNATIISGDGTSQITFSPTGPGLITIHLAAYGTDRCFAFADAVSVTVDVPDTTITASGPTTFCAGGSVTLTAPSYATYLWSNGATTQSITVNASGNYRVAVTDANGCSATSAATTVVVNQPVKPAITADGPTTFCQWSKVVLTSSTGSSYLWSNGTTTASITVTTGGSYTVTTVDSNGCSATSDPVVVTVDAALAQPTATAQGSTSICPGGSVSMTVTPNGGGNGVYSYQWYGTSGPISGATSATYTASPSSNTSYYAVISDSIGCSSTSSNAIVVTVNSNPSATITAPAAVCDGQTNSASVPDSGTGATYAWTVTNGTLDYTTSNGAVAFFHNGPGSSSVVLTVTVTTAAGCTATSQQTIAVTPLPSATITPNGPTTFCQGGNVTLSAPAGMSGYTWSDGSHAQSITVSANGTYSVTVTSSSGCSSHSGGVTVTVNTNPTPSITAPPAICAGATGSASTAAIAGASYAWTIANGTITSGAGTNAVTFTSASGPVTLGVTVTNSSNCSGTASATVAVNALPNATITAPSGICSGSTGSASVTAISGGSYSWSIAGGTITGGGGTNAIMFTSTGSNVSLSVTVTSNGCSSSSSTNVAVNANPTTPAITAGGPTTFCAGGSVTLNGPAASGYHWSNGAITQSIVVSASGTFTVSVTNASGCASAQSAPVTVTVNPATAITQQPASATIPKNTTITLSVTATGTGTLTYQWYNPPTANNNDTSKKVGTSSPTFTTPKLSNGPHYYYVVVTGSCGTVRSAIATITAN